MERYKTEDEARLLAAYRTLTYQERAPIDQCAQAILAAAEDDEAVAYGVWPNPTWRPKN